MLASKFRLREKKDFEDVYQKGDFLKFENFSLIILKKNEADVSRFGFVVSTKISKRAVMRNKIKRALREGILKNLKKIKSGYDCIILVKPSIVKKYNQEIFLEVEKALKKAELI